MGLTAMLHKGYGWSILWAAFMIGAPAAANPRILMQLDLSKDMGTRSPWIFTATQGADIPDLTGDDGPVPGPIKFCLSADHGHSCAHDFSRILRLPGGDDLFSEAHQLNELRVVHPRGKPALLLLKASSIHSSNNDQRVALVLMTYDRTRDAFAQAYQFQTRRNNSQEVRYIANGPLEGAVISAEPTSDAPFAFWIIVNKLGASGHYQQVLRYRSATRYGDGNPLAVIDSEMPTIQSRLGLWRQGQPLPLPAGQCLKPHLIKQELWC